ncbi:MAG: rRNA maturation RNAse YbeY, partial [Planctomycetes bacterium]|nr:rRNA maturation RNAse YbeY [Planctomycetota bacterium]
MHRVFAGCVSIVGLLALSSLACAQELVIDWEVVRVFVFVDDAVTGIWVRSDPNGTAGVSIAIADDETLRSLNSRFRGLDEVTDVLAFGLDATP